ncbi:F-box/kelch-repeat protein At1g57790-like [Syzygium oleosum]|uniref:F-box/kelch-repeat protein At1g57790-like n=1 Tax=Syzygium oleosum TaxID=219896 RepID=UPI0024BAE7B8|nr:F-box/kelch-repeat protein At1g57790-like [Syzygium oleosum]
MANWEELPQVIRGLIVRRLATEDFLAVRRVCTSWRTAAAKETFNAKSRAPWLMIYTYSRIAKFCSPSTGSTYPVQLPRYHGQTMSTPGWILVSRGPSEYRIVNPLSCISIELPALEKLHGDIHHIHKIALSSSPSLSRSYAVMISYGRSQGFAFLRSGDDAWTAVNDATHLPWSNVIRLVYYDGLFVALDEQSRIMTLNERKSRMESRLVLGLDCYADGDPYLVECSGSLLVAWKIWGEKYGGYVKEIRAFKVDLEKGTEEEIKSLGNASIFLNGNASFSVEFNAESCLPGIKPNSVYYPDYEDDQMKSYGMEDGKFETYIDETSSCLFDATSNCLYYDATNRRRIYEAKWFQPDF